MEQYKCFALQNILQFSTTIIRVISKTELPFRMVGVEERLQGFQGRIKEEWRMEPFGRAPSFNGWDNDEISAF